ncbi:MAG: GNAT family N-acetyltransferase, partial [Jatrophihabitans endophyticus]
MIEPSWVGRRVSVRRVLERRPDGRLLQGDVVGDLTELDTETAVIESRGGLVQVPLGLVTIAKLAPPSTADELALERVIAAGWRAADSLESDGWTLRADHGFTKRANSVLPLRQLGAPLDEALATTRAWYAARGLPVRFQLPTEARRLLDAELGERGWEPSPDVAVLVRRLDRAADAPTASAAPVAAAPPLALDDAPDDSWLALWRDGAAPDVARALLTR